MLNNNFPTYDGPEGSDPEGFDNQQLRILAELLRSMGIYELTQNPKDQNSPILVKYVNFNEDAEGSRLVWRTIQ